MITPISTLKRWFANFKKPTQEQFWAWIDSYWHKSEKIPMDTIDGLENAIRGTASADQLRNHLTDSQAHKELFEGKVDKVPGKILSTNDFTNELRTKLEGLRQVDISGLLPKGGYTGTAQNLKELIDNLMRIIESPDTELDELREIVAYIKQNKRILDTLGISNIAGLQDALNGKAPTDHHHDDRYSRLGHTHPEYAYRTHRHHWDNIDGIPALATEGKIAEAIGKIQVGGRNLLRETKEFGLNNSWAAFYIVRNYSTEGWDIVPERFNGNVVRKVTGDWQGIKTEAPDILGEPVIISFWAKTNAWAKFGNYATIIKNPNEIKDFTELSNGGVLINDNQWHRYTIYNPKGMCLGEGVSNGFIEFYQVNGEVLVSSIKIERGSIPTDWTPAPEDIGIGTVMNETRQILPYEDVVYVTATVPNCDLQMVPDRRSVAFRKVFAAGQVTFTCAGKTIIYTGDNSFNGGDGSTAVVSIYGNKCYIDIRNV